MKKYILLCITIAFLAAFSFTGCKEDNTPDVNEYQLMTDYLKANNLDLDKILTGFVIFPAAETDVATKYIMDLRSAADYANGHITGAVNVAFKDILTEAAKAAGKPILVVCYSGQTATYASTLLRMYGFSDAAALKWGMSGWNATFDKWTANCKDLKSDANWDASAVAASVFSTPVISTGAAAGPDILKKRVEAVVAAGFKSIAPADVLANPAGYFVNNYVSDAHYTGFGHVKGAYRIQPITLVSGNNNNLDPSKKIVTYCYTGQTSGAITAWLNVLGYDAYSCLWGINGLTYTNAFWTSGAVTNHWGFDSKSKTFTTVK